ncbi:MAG: hypothetical protein ABUT20_47370, partial [Bacteroidota bacterium]
MSEIQSTQILSEGVSSGSFKRMRKNRAVRWAMNGMIALLLIALLAPLLANEKPLYMRYRDEIFFPALWDMNPFTDKNFYETRASNGHVEQLQLDITDWKKLDYQNVIWCLVPYSPGKSDYPNSNFISPFGEQHFQNLNEMPLRFRHFLGTGIRGEDVLAGLIHGTRISLLVGIFSMLFASLIGLLLGALAGYYGDHKLQASKVTLFFSLLGIALGFFYGFYVRAFLLEDAMRNSMRAAFLEVGISFLYFFLLFFFCLALGNFFSRRGISGGTVYIPVDNLISRTIEIIISLPVFIVILSIAAITQASFLNLVLIIAFTS